MAPNAEAHAAGIGGNYMGISLGEELEALGNIQYPSSPKLLSSTYVDGIDVSNHQGTISWPLVYNDGYRFAFAKATEGYGFTDAQFTTNMSNAKNAGIMIGPYHFARPDLNSDPAVEANYFYDITRDYLTEEYLRPVLDLEVKPATMSWSDLSNWADDFLATYNVRSGGVIPLMYINSNYAINLDSTLDQYDLWIANWTYDPDGTAPNTGKWPDWEFWQYSNSGTVSGISGYVDLNVFFADETVLLNFTAEGMPDSDTTGLTRWHNHFGRDDSAGGWNEYYYPRIAGDVNGDGMEDIVGFGYAYVQVAISDGNSFGAVSTWTSKYTYLDGWRVDDHVRVLADANGDGKDDILGFDGAGVLVSLSSGSSFEDPQRWATYFGSSIGSENSKHIRTAGDVDGDVKDDIVGFGDEGVWVSISSGSSYSNPTMWSDYYDYNQWGWRVDQHVRRIADVNGDGMDDIVGFGNTDTYVSLSTGSSFNSISSWIGHYGFDISAGSWRVISHPRWVKDVNADGKADIVGFGNDGVSVALSNGSSFESGELWLASKYGKAQNWQYYDYVRTVADVNNDNKSDIIGFAHDGIYASLSEGTQFTENQSPALVIQSPALAGESANGVYTITWNDYDPDDNAEISLYYDGDNIGGEGILIVDKINEDDTQDFYIWDISNTPDGEYYIYGIIDDGTNPQVTTYSSGTVIVDHNLASCAINLCNAGFENGLNYWAANGLPNNQISTDSIEGLYSLYSEHTLGVGEIPSWSGISQKINLAEPAQTYGISIWLKSLNVSRAHVKIKWYDTSSNITQVDYPITNINGTINSWTQFSKLVTSPSDAVSGELFIWHGVDINSENVAGSTLWIDNIEFDVATSACGTLCNESFEHGTLYWITSGKAGSHAIETIGAYEGTKVLKSEQLYTSSDTVKWAGISQFAQVKDVTTYKLKLWLKTLNASNGHVRIKWRDTSGNLIYTRYPIQNISGTNGTWFAREATFTSPAGSVKAEISVWHGVSGNTTNINGSTIWIDAISLICINLCNGGFEDGSVHWESNGKNEGEIITSNVKEGINAMKISQNLSAADNVQWAGINQKFSVGGGKNYFFSFWLRYENLVQGHIKIKWRDSNDQLISQHFPWGGINGTRTLWWNQYATLTAPINAETAEVFFWHGVDLSNNNATGSTLYLDDFKANQKPTLQILSPSLPGETASSNYTIAWSNDDLDNNASISLYYDDDNLGGNGTQIIDGIPEDDDQDFYVWDVSNVPEGNYYIYGIISDGVNIYFADYSSGTVTVSQGS